MHSDKNALFLVYHLKSVIYPRLHILWLLVRIKHEECSSLAFLAQNLWLVLWLQKNRCAGPELPSVSAGSFWLLTRVRPAQESVRCWAVTPQNQPPCDTFRWHCSGGPERYSRDWGPKLTSSPKALWGYVGHHACGYSLYSSDADNSKHLPCWAHPIFQQSKTD